MVRKIVFGPLLKRRIFGLLLDNIRQDIKMLLYIRFSPAAANPLLKSNIYFTFFCKKNTLFYRILLNCFLDNCSGIYYVKYYGSSEQMKNKL